MHFGCNGCHGSVSPPKFLNDAADSPLVLTAIDDTGGEIPWTKSPAYAIIGIS